MERALLESLLNQVRKGKRAESGFKSEAWKVVVKQVQAQIVQRGADGKSIRKVTQQQASNKYSDFKGMFAAWKGLYNASGFGWNDELELFEADDSVWETYIEVQFAFSILKTFSKCAEANNMSLRLIQRQPEFGIQHCHFMTLWRNCFHLWRPLESMPDWPRSL
jgi:hypothetical protein